MGRKAVSEKKHEVSMNKSVSASEPEMTLENVLAGKVTTLDNTVYEEMVNLVNNNQRPRYYITADNKLVFMSDREIFKMICTGWSRTAIAEKFSCSVAAISQSVSRIKSELTEYSVAA